MPRRRNWLTGIKNIRTRKTELKKTTTDFFRARVQTHVSLAEEMGIPPFLFFQRSVISWDGSLTSRPPLTEAPLCPPPKKGDGEEGMGIAPQHYFSTLLPLSYTVLTPESEERKLFSGFGFRRRVERKRERESRWRLVQFEKRRRLEVWVSLNSKYHVKYHRFPFKIIVWPLNKNRSFLNRKDIWGIAAC